jgi:hypothetical protein
MRRNCLTTDRVAGPCHSCGAYVSTDMHMPLTRAGFFCAACCPECNAKKSRTTERRRDIRAVWPEGEDKCETAILLNSLKLSELLTARKNQGGER